ncbi:hypothetical protein MRB53_041726 [Persea americana]|nr:hypothetical protein MRB53_041726 [Persea americana]
MYLEIWALDELRCCPFACLEAICAFDVAIDCIHSATAPCKGKALTLADLEANVFPFCSLSVLTSLRRECRCGPIDVVQGGGNVEAIFQTCYAEKALQLSRSDEYALT